MSLSIALIAGLIGSIATAALGYAVQNALANRRRAEEERRLAYVYFAKVSSLLANWVTVIAGITPGRNEVENTALELLRSPSFQAVFPGQRSYDALHAMCVAASVVLRAKEGETIRNRIRGLMDALDPDLVPSGLEIAPTDLARFPRAAVVAYCAFEEAVRDARGTTNSFKRYLVSGDEHLSTPEILIGHILVLVRMKDTALNLRQALISRCGIDRTEADGLVEEQIRSMSQYSTSFAEEIRKVRAANADLDVAFRKAMADLAEQNRPASP